MTLKHPFEISARLLPCIRVGTGSSISIEAIHIDDEGRTVFRYYIDTPDFEHSEADLKSGVGQRGPAAIQQAFGSLLAFLTSGDADEMFPARVAEWAAQHADELSILGYTIEETPGLLF